MRVIAHYLNDEREHTYFHAGCAFACAIVRGGRRQARTNSSLSSVESWIAAVPRGRCQGVSDPGGVSTRPLRPNGAVKSSHGSSEAEPVDRSLAEKHAKIRNGEHL